jgi:hypothetical protein
MNAELEDSLIEFYSTHSGDDLMQPSTELTERLLFVRELMLEHPAPEEPGAYILVTDLEDKPFWKRIEDKLTIGRSTDSDLPMMRSWVSREHCTIEAVGPDHQVTDAGSQNGIRVNGEKVGERLLCKGDIIQVGKVSLIFVVVD